MRHRLAAATLVVAGLFAGPPGAVRAQSATVEMTADRTEVGVGETFQVQVRAEANGAEPELVVPRFDAFQVLSRRMARPMQFRFGFGNRQQVVQSTTVYDFTLRALSEGSHRIEPAKATVGGRTFQSQPLTIVVGGGGAPAGVPPTDPAPPGNTVDAAEWDPTAFVRTVVDDDEVYVGEQLTVTLYLYSRGGIRSSPTVHEEPTTDGFWVHDLLPPNRTLDPHRQVVDGVAFNVYVLRRFAAFPLQAGELRVGGMEISLSQGSLFDIFNQQVTEVRRRGDPVKVRVRELPAQGRPQDPVVVGDFTLEASLDRSQVATGDAVTLTAVVRGSGNVHDARLTLPAVPGLRILQPQVSEEVVAPGDRVGGSRTYEWLIVPEQPGTHRIPPLALTAFHPDGERYERIASDALTLLAAGNSVQGPDEPGGETDPSPEPAEDQAVRFGPVRTRSDLERGVTSIASSLWFLALLAIPPLTWLGLLLAGVTRRRLAERGLAGAPDRAVKRARRRLGAAEEHAERGDPRAFYAEIFQVLKDVLEARLGEPVGGFTHDELRRHLVVRGMQQDLALRVVDELEGLEFARFSSTGTAPDEMRACVERVQALLARLDGFTPAREVDE